MKRIDGKLTVVLAGWLLVSNPCAWAQATQAEMLDRGGGAVSDKKTARNLAEELLAAKGWVEGLNKNASGDEYFVAIGAGDIQAPVSDPNYLDSRVNAYDKAMMAAWASIRQFVGEEVSSKMSSSYREATGEIPPSKEVQAAMAAGKQVAGVVMDTAMAVLPSTNPKLAALVNAAAGSIEKQSNLPKEQALASEEFRKAVATAASGPIVGVQSYSTFEGPGGGKGFQIVVIAIWSEKLQKLAEAMLYGTAAPAGTPGKSVDAWIPKDTAELITAFGVQMVKNENGQPVLLAYGQSRPLTESSRSVEAAYSKALLEAKSQLRFFAGAQAQVLEDLEKYENTDEYSDATKEYASASVFEQSTDVYAPAEKFAGMARKKTWNAPHPITGNMMVGVVAMWSPESALIAQKINQQMSAPPSRSPAAISPAQPAVTRTSIDDSNQGLTGGGVTGSDDF